MGSVDANFSPGVRKVIALALLVLAIMAGVSLLLGPAWRTYAENRESIADDQYRLVRLKEISRRQPELLKAETELRKRQAETGHIMSERSAPLAAAALQERVKAVVEGTGGSVSSARVLPAVPEGAFQRVTVSVRLSLTNEALQAVLFELESAVPYLVVNNVAINSRRRGRSNRSRRRRNRAPTVVATPNRLDVVFELSGYIRNAA
ncbi:MAG: type II secretion system protein GspM [Pseudomonadota bacterium]